MLKKQYLKTKPECKVTFSFNPGHGDQVHLVGDFNGWDEQATPMKRAKDGTFSVTLNLATGHDYQFRYLVDGTEWHNDVDADKYLPNPYSGDNSVVSV